MSVGIHYLYSSPVIATGLSGSLLMFHWRDVPALAEFQTAMSTVDAALANRADKVLYLSAMEGSCRTPDQEIRKHMAEAAKKHADKIAATSLLLAGEGMKVAALRAVLAGLMLVSSSKYPMKVSGTNEEAAAFLSSHAVGMSGAAIASAIRDIRARPAGARA